MEGYKELSEKLNRLVNALENGELGLEQLNELESVTRDLHERSIILRYKAFEKTVLGASKPVEVTTEQEEVTAVEEVVEEVKPAVEEEVQEEESAFDFAIFDQSEDTSTEESEEQTDSEATEISIEIEDEQEEPEAEKEAPAPEPEPEKVENLERVEMEAKEQETIEPVATPDPVPAQSQSGNSFLDKFSQQDNSVGGRFSAGPLESLIGAFGLNERLRFINDLFDGSSEKFSDAIKALDSQSDIDSARAKAAGYAEENEWDPEEEVVAEFMNYLSRRYA